MQLPTNETTDWLNCSWMRSSDAGLHERRLPQEARVKKSQLNERRAMLATLISAVEKLALPFFNQLFARTNSRLILTDTDGVIIGSWGQKQFQSKLTTIALESGVCWRENLKGTNAIGTAIVEEKPISIIGDQHFIHQHRFISCTASPIFDHNNNMLAILDITSEQQVHHANTQHLIQNMVQNIESELLCQLPQGTLRVDLAMDNSILNSGWQGIVIADQQGQIIAHNKVASQLLEHEQMIGRPIEHLLQQEQQSFVFKIHPLSEQKKQSSTTYSQACSLHYGDERVEHGWQQASKVINKQINLLILGETGVGKGEFVKALHKQSNRKQGPLVVVNCGALPKDLVESELFGYAPGAFTGANSKGYQGKVRQADKGILFLDEIADMPLDAQCRLLHVLQDKEVVPVGSNKKIDVDIQVIAATHKNLEQQVELGLFRQDLYYRLNGLLIEIPPLRNRKDKVALINKLHQKHALTEQTLSPDLVELLTQYPWPGNIRQLDNVIKVASLLASDETVLCLKHIPDNIAREITTTTPNNTTAETNLQTTIEDKLLATYQANQGNISRTSKILGVSRNTIYRKLKKLGM
ncbi:sigma-54-dependent Fis family transcriptional regulator [Vibrio sp. 99-8-1]|uniref:sigma-54-dependent Fis family transcriptional regulator n=1 Tax=Vibrio sp. 99-8-1 TaxID=2607602 RepID=UPI001493BAD8|nr:sigma-54-dependent Fis family transcriptional regulator [Vibrio sp. 99-8-1]NOI67437.1 sigma-54-dependent Fis family transcriptional regulator [Vibrio sp. 99-8-1]